MPPPPSPTKANSLWKGKEKLSEPSEFDDLNPVLTYRHVLSQNLGVRDPLRVIALCDSDAFYANCEMVRLNVGPEIPLVVLQWESIIAVNYAARKFGISRMDKKKDALKRCPELKIVHVATYKEGEKEPGYWESVDTNTHKVSLDHYRRESMKIAALFKEELPGCEVEKASIDEAFIDFTKPVREILLQRYPHLAQVPEDALEDLDTPLPPPPFISWDGLGNLIPVNPPPPSPPETPEEKADQKSGCPASGQEEHASAGSSSTTPIYAGDETLSTKLPSIDELQQLEEEPALTWHDVALSIAAELMGKAREEVRIKLGYSTSAGISKNKFLAKLTASYRKPNSQSILRNAAIPNYLKPMAFQKIRFLGGKLGKAIAEVYDVSTVGDLLTIGLEEMQTKFGEQSIWVYEILRGIDRNEVKDKGSALNKSMLASKNLPQAITKPSEGHHWIRVLAAELALRLRDARDISPNLWPKSLVLHARKGYDSGRSKQAPFPFTKDPSVDFISNIGNKLWKELVGNNSTLNVTNVQLAFTGIDVAESGQQSIEGFLKPSSTSGSKRRLSISDVDSSAIPLFGVEEGCRGEGSKQRSDTKDKRKATSSRSDGNPSNTPAKATYVCQRCRKTFSLPSLSSADEEVDGAADTSAYLSKVKMEHEDWHFAQDLASEGFERKVISVTKPPSKVKAATIGTSKPSGPPKAKRRKTPPEYQGLHKFFGKS